MIKAKPCPFCGNETISVVEGSSYRWRVAECGGCGARAGEVRINTLAEDKAQALADVVIRAVSEWNDRKGAN
jgi:transcription elongation factor Elf1